MESFRYTAGNSDKVYHIQLVENNPNNSSIRVQYGRFGSYLKNIELNSGSNWLMEDAYKKQVASKLKKGYKSIEVPDSIKLLAEMEN